MRKALAWIASSMMVVASAQAPQEPLIKNTFKDDAGGWIGVGPSAKIVIFHDPALAAPTTGALRLNYGINKGEINALYMPTPVGSLKEAKSIKFWVRADASTVMVVSMQEEEGGRYAALFYAPKDQWQPVELAMGDFALAMEKDDPKDPNGKLDLDLVSGFFVGDVSQFFAQVEDPVVSALFDIKKGPHTLYLDDFTVGTEALTPSTTSAGDDVRLDTFNHPQLAWFGVGGAKLSRAIGTPLEGAGLKAEYRQAPGKMVMFTRQVHPWVLTQAKSLSLDVASANAAKLVVQVEENGGGKYNATIDVPAGSQVKRFSLPFADFKAADDSKDTNGKLDVGNVKSLLIFDATGVTEKVDRDNTLWINNLVGVAK